MLPYSHRFIGGRVASGGQLSYTVPAGYVGIVRSISMVNISTGPQNQAAIINGAWQLCAFATVPANGMSTYETRQVLNAGDTLAVGTSAGGFDVTVSGYLLANLP